MLIHGIALDDLLLGTMIPLIKNSRGKKLNSDNYRSLTIGTGLAKLLDIVMLNQQSEKLKTCDQQFGFKEKSSTKSHPLRHDGRPVLVRWSHYLQPACRGT